MNHSFRLAAALGLALLGVIVGLGPAAAQDAPESARTTTSAESRAYSYAFVYGDHWVSTNKSLDDVLRLRRRTSGDFLWFRRGGRSYVIRDAATLTRAAGLFDPLRKLDPERRELERRERMIDEKERVLEREQEKLDRLADRLSDEDDESEDERSARRDSEREDVERRQRDLQARMRPVEEERREVEAIERTVEAKEDALERKAEAELWKVLEQAVASGIALPSSK